MPLFLDIKSGIIDNIENALETWNTYMNRVMQLITTSPEYFKASGSSTSILWQIMSGINTFLQGVGLALLVLFFAIGIIKTCGSFTEAKRPEMVLKMFVRFAIAKFAVINGLDMLMDAYLIVQGIVVNLFSELSGKFSIFYTYTDMDGKVSARLAGFDLPDEVREAVQEMGFTDIFDKLGLWLITFLAGLFVIVMAFIVLMTVYGRFFKFYMYAAISPLPLSTFASESTQNYGKAYVRNFIAVSLEAIVIFLAITFFAAYAEAAPLIFDSAGLDAPKIVWNYLMELFLMMLILVGTIKASDHVVKEMFGLGG